METVLAPRKHLRIFKLVAPTATFKGLQPWHLEQGFLPLLLHANPPTPHPRELSVQKEITAESRRNLSSERCQLLSLHKRCRCPFPLPCTPIISVAAL